jgi:hypothetical protein
MRVSCGPNLFAMPAALPAAVRAFCSAVVLASIAASPDEPCEPSRPTVVCKVQVEELPAVLRGSGSYEIVWGHKRVPLPGSGAVHVALDEPTVVRLDGPAYHGSVSIDPADCSDEAVHVIEAGPKPAKLIFQAGAVPLADLIVSCVSGCPYQLRPADNFPELPFSREDTELAVKLEFKAPGHRARTIEFRLTPGDNTIRVTLQELDG